MKRVQKGLGSRAMVAVIGLVYGQISFADGGLIPQIKGASDIAGGNKEGVFHPDLAVG